MYESAGTESNNTSGTTRALSYIHDNNSNRTRLTYPDNKYVVYGYDGLNRLGLTSLPSSSGSVLLRFDNYARPKAIERANNADTNLRYDALSRLNQLSDDMANSGYDNTFDYDYNPANQLIQQDISNGRYHYDIKNQTGLNHNYSVNGLNQYINVAGKSHSYDANGNLTNDGNTIYTYDVENRLIRARGAKVADLTYDPAGRLSKIVAGGQTTYFMYDGNALVAEYTGSTISKRYVHSVEVDHPIAEYSGSGTTTSNVSYLHRNHQGSIIAASKGNGRGDYFKNYDAFGRMAGSTQGRFAYTGQIYIPELDLYHYKARAYNPRIGRFMQTDPVGYEDQMNLYAYVGNDPLNANDPSGEVIWHLVGAGIGAGFNLGAQLISNGGDFKSVNYSQVAVAGLAGAAGVGLGGVISKTVTEIGLSGVKAIAVNVGGNTAAGAFIGLEATLANAALDEIDGDGGSIVGIGKNVRDGAIFGAAGAVLGETAVRSVKNAGGKLLGNSGSMNGAGRAVAEGVTNTVSNGGDLKNVVVDEIKERLRND